MSRILVIILGLIFSINIYAQDTYPDRRISFQDSILLNNFWTDFKTAIENNDKEKLSALCKFPFDCTFCTDDTSLKNNDFTEVKVTRKIFYKSQYKEFYDTLIRHEVEKHKYFETYIFYPVENKNSNCEFKFSYTIVAPSDKWEGMQGFIYLRKINDKYKITRLETVP